MSGFAIIPDNHPAIGVDHHDGGGTDMRLHHHADPDQLPSLLYPGEDGLPCDDPSCTALHVTVTAETVNVDRNSKSENVECRTCGGLRIAPTPRAVVHGPITPEFGLTGFAIIPDNQPAIGVDHHDDGIRITIGDTTTVLTAKEARQLESAIGRLRLWPGGRGDDVSGGSEQDCGLADAEKREPSVRMPVAMYRVDSGPPPDDWPDWRRMFGIKAQTYRAKGHALNQVAHLRKLGYQDVAIYEAQLEWVDITPSTPENVEEPT